MLQLSELLAERDVLIDLDDLFADLDLVQSELRLSSWRGRMRENFEAAAITLTTSEVIAVDALETGARVGADPATAAFTQF